MKEMQNLPVRAYIGLGSNQNNPAGQIQEARLTLSKIQGITECKFSSMYSSPPMGPQNQPDYVNAVMEIETDLSALELLARMQQVEKSQGRVRSGERWGPRTLDLDLLLYGQEQINLPDLIVPHAGIQNRAFVLYPLQEISPDLEVPGLGALEKLISGCPRDGLKQL